MYSINKNASGEYITGVVYNAMPGNATYKEFVEVLAAIKNKPEHGKRLRADTKTWEIELPTETPDDIISSDKAVKLIFGDKELTRKELQATVKRLAKFSQLADLIEGFGDSFTLAKLNKLYKALKEVLKDGG